MDYLGDPVIGLGDGKTLRISLRNESGEALRGHVALEAPEGWQVALAETAITLSPGDSVDWDAVVTAPESLPVLEESNLLTVGFTGDTGVKASHTFGLAGATVWEVYGPYWENLVTVPPLKPGETYWGPVTAGAATEDDTIDRVRHYHLNALAAAAPDAPEGERRAVNLYEDRFTVSDLVGWQGACGVHLRRKLICPEDRMLFLNIGHSDAYKLWINGALVSERSNVAWWTPENVHVSNVSLRKGKNDIVLYLERNGLEAAFSLIFTVKNTCGAHLVDMASANPAMAE